MIGVTHDGSFHADDVFATVVLKKIFPSLKIKRSRDMKVIDKADVVYDVGRVYDPKVLRFDHHQNGAPVRENGIAYSSFGLVWREFGVKFCGDKKIAEDIDKKIVQPVDAGDNGFSITKNTVKDVNQMSINDVIELLNPINRLEAVNNRSYDKKFKEAVKLAEIFLNRLIAKERDKQSALRLVRHELEKSADKRFVVLKKAISLEGLSAEFPELLYVVYPVERDEKWWIHAVSKPDDEFKQRKPFPKKWAGLETEELKTVTGVEDVYFSHKKRFLVVTETEPGARAVVKKALE